MKKPKRLWWKVTKDKRGHFRVSARASNGRKVFASSEGYYHRHRAVENACEHGAPYFILCTPLDEETRWPP